MTDNFSAQRIQEISQKYFEIMDAHGMFADFNKRRILDNLERWEIESGTDIPVEFIEERLKAEAP